MTEGLNRRGDRLYATAQANQAANRASLLRAQEEQSTIDTARRLSAEINRVLSGFSVPTFRPNIATGDGPRRRPEPPTPTLNKRSSVNRIWYAQKTTATQVLFTLFAGDGITSQEYHFDILPHFINEFDRPFWESRSQYEWQTLVLPINSYSSIFLIGYVNTEYANYLVVDFNGLIEHGVVWCTGSASQIARRAFYVGQDTVTEITLPNSINTTFFQPYVYLPVKDQLYVVYEGIWPPYAYTTFPDNRTLYTFSKAKFGDIYQSGINAFNAANPYYILGFNFGPGILNYFNNHASALALLDWESLDNPENPLYNTWLMDAVYSFIGLDNMPTRTLTLSLLDPKGLRSQQYNGEYPPTVSNPEYSPLNKSIWTKSQQNNHMAAIPTDPYETEPSRSTLKVSYYWDWNKPGYCREQLLALGFTTADLTP